MFIMISFLKGSGTAQGLKDSTGSIPHAENDENELETNTGYDGIEDEYTISNRKG